VFRGSRGSSPVKNPPPRGDIFTPGELQGFRGLSDHDLGAPSSIRPPLKLKGSQAGFPEAQDIVWLDDEGQPVNAPPGDPILGFRVYVLPGDPILDASAFMFPYIRSKVILV
jgi:hypothetical protein